jgi:hypothetical protein
LVPVPRRQRRRSRNISARSPMMPLTNLGIVTSGAKTRQSERARRPALSDGTEDKESFRHAHGHLPPRRRIRKRSIVQPPENSLPFLPVARLAQEVDPG